MLMNLLSGNGRLLVGDVMPGIFDNMSTTEVSTTEPGFVVVYVDNQTMGKDVWFDNVQVLHYNTQVLEENHYYPFGLTTSVNAIGITSQPLKYQTKELEKSFGIEMYDFHARQYDPQIGRFHSIDPMAAKFDAMSPYTGMGNNPVSYIDPDGQEIKVRVDIDNKGNFAEMIYGQVDGKWGLINVDGNLYEGSVFGNEVVQALNKLRTESGEFGEEFITSIVDAKETVNIREGKGDTETLKGKGIIRANPHAKQMAPTEQGNQVIPFDIALGHELDHAFNNVKGVKFDIWTKVENSKGNINISQSEISAMHVENKLRASRNLPLRTHYSSSQYGAETNTEVVDDKGRSLYYNSSGKFIFKNEIPKANKYKYRR